MAKGKIIIEIDDNNFKVLQPDDIGNGTVAAVLLRYLDNVFTDEGLSKEQATHLIETTIGSRE